MFKNKIIRWSTLAMIMAILAYFIVETFQSQPTVENGAALAKIPDETFAANLEAERQQKDEFFRTSGESPIEDKKLFTGLVYFEPDQAYRVLAKLTPYDGAEKELKITYTDGTAESYERYAYADFDIKGDPQRLLLLKNEGTISVLFKDKTSGDLTYGGGRYLDIPIGEVKGNTLVLDFNKAYSPYCAYVPDYACPLPPKENTLDVAVEAGEKYIEEKH